MMPIDPLSGATSVQRKSIERALSEQEHHHGQLSSGGRQRFLERRYQQIRAMPHLHILEHVAGRCLTDYGWDQIDYAEISRGNLATMLERAYQVGASAARNPKPVATTQEAPQDATRAADPRLPTGLVQEAAIDHDGVARIRPSDFPAPDPDTPLRALVAAADALAHAVDVQGPTMVASEHPGMQALATAASIYRSARAAWARLP